MRGGRHRCWNRFGLLAAAQWQRILEGVVDFGRLLGGRCGGTMGSRGRGDAGGAGFVGLVQLAELLGHFDVLAAGFPGEVVGMSWCRCQ